MSSLFDDNGGRDWKKIGYHGRSAFAVLLSLAILLGGGIFAYTKIDNYWTSYRTATDFAGPGGSAVTVTIPSGSTGGQIGDLLVAKDVVKSRKGFLKAYNNNSDASKIQAGTYKLPTEIPSAQAVTMLLDTKNMVRNQVTVPEGLWKSQVFSTLSKKTGIPVAQFTAAASNPQALGYPSYVKDVEGFLYPSTYEVGQKPTATSILKLMAAQYNTIATKYDMTTAAAKLDRTPEQIMTVASILQAEARAKDMPTVAGIIYNRLEQGIPLGLDSTAHYQLQIPMSQSLPSNFQQQGTSSSYNTYANQGLPDGPIDSPGETAIKAALNPVKSDYLYWLTVNFDTGETKYAKTQAEQDANEAEWKAWCKSKGNPAGCPSS